MKRCIKDPRKNRNVFYTFCTFEMLIDAVKCLSKKLKPFILLSSVDENAYFPTSLPALSIWSLKTVHMMGMGGRGIRFIVVFNSFITRKVDHLFESCLYSLLSPLTDVAAIAILWIVNVSLSYFSPSEACLSALSAMNFTIKSVKPQTAYLFHYGFWVSFAT